MTIIEMSKIYNIPINILKEYEKWELCGTKKEYQYSDADLKYLSIIMTLYDIGFKSKEVKIYMNLLIDREDTKNERICILNQKRSNILNEIHFKERQMDKLDYLRHKIINNKNK